MSKKIRRKFTDEVKKTAVNDYVSGAKQALQIATDLGVEVQTIYRWKTHLDEKAKGIRVRELEDHGCSLEMAKRISQLEDEISAYQKKVAEQTILIDLLKKIQNPMNLQPMSEFSGLIATTKKLGQNKRRVK